MTRLTKERKQKIRDATNSGKLFDMGAHGVAAELLDEIDELEKLLNQQHKNDFWIEDLRVRVSVLESEHRKCKTRSNKMKRK